MSGTTSLVWGQGNQCGRSRSTTFDHFWSQNKVFGFAEKSCGLLPPKPKSAFLQKDWLRAPLKLFGKWLFSGFQHFRLKTVGSQILGKVHFFGHFSCKHDCSCVRHLSWAHDNRESHTSAYCLRSRHLRLGAGQYAIIRLSAKQSRSSRKRVTLISRFGKHSHSFTIVSETKFGTLVLGD